MDFLLVGVTFALSTGLGVAAARAALGGVFVAMGPTPALIRTSRIGTRG
jgi:hypothetical protein